MLFQTECALTVGAFFKTGYVVNGTYRIALTVEDYTQYPVELGNEVFANQRGFSRIPIQVGCYGNAWNFMR